MLTMFIGREREIDDLNFISIVGLAPRKGMTDARQRRNFCERLSIRTALVYDGKLAASVPADRYFDFIVPAEELL